jgi:hypothetical protein
MTELKLAEQLVEGKKIKLLYRVPSGERSALRWFVNNETGYATYVVRGAKITQQDLPITEVQLPPRIRRGNYCVAMRGDGRNVVVAYLNNEAYFWDPSTNTEVFGSDCQFEVEGFDFETLDIGSHLVTVSKVLDRLCAMYPELQRMTVNEIIASGKKFDRPDEQGL